MKHLIYFLMIVDHIGWLFFPNEIWIRIVGHIFWQMFVYFPVLGWQQTKETNQYISKLLKWAIITQIILIIFAIIDERLWTGQLNILFTLAWGIICLSIIKKYPKYKMPIIIAFMYCAIIFQFEYGATAIWAMYLFSIYNKTKPIKWWLFWIMAIVFGVFEISLHYIMLASILPPAIIFKIQKRFKMKRIIPKLPSLFWYAYYPAQFAVLMSIFVLTN